MTEEKRNWNPLVFLVRQLAKFLPNNKYISTFIVPLVFVFIFFIFFQIYEPKSFILNLEICVGIYIFLTLWLFVDEFFERKQHRKALEGKKLRQLSNLNLLVENIGEYWGYSGTISKYYFKIFYNWSTILPGKSNYREICIMAYFSSPITMDDKLDIIQLNALNEKYKNGWLSSNNYVIRFESAHIEIHTAYGWFTSFKTIKKRIDLVLEILEKEKLSSISESEVNKLIAKDAYRYGPSIDTFWKAKGIL